MQAVFVHDHKFPMYDGEYYESSGFDNVFIHRYLDIFENLTIIARYHECLQRPREKFNVLNANGLEFCLFKSTQEAFRLKNIKQLKRILKKSNYAVIRLPSVIGFWVIQICLMYNIPYIIEVVGCPWDSIICKGLRYGAFAGIYALATRHYVKNACYVVYVTERFLEDRYPTNGRFINCSNVTLENYGSCSMGNRLEKIANYNSRKITVFTCGDLSADYKGQDDVIKAVAILKKRGIIANYFLIGGGNPKRLVDLSEKLSIKEQIHFVGELPHRDVFDFIDGIDLCIHPSKQEGLCRAIIEAMSRGCPILAADAGGIREQIDESCIFAKGDVKKIVKLVSELTKEKMKNMAISNYENASKYKSEILYKRRKEFFYNFIQENK